MSVALVVFVLSLALPRFPAWLGDWVLVACPPSILLMATEVCGSRYDWCSIQFVLIMVVLNAALYALVGAVLSLVASAGRRALGGDRSRDAA